MPESLDTTDLPSREARESVAAVLRADVDKLFGEELALVLAHRSWLYGGPPARAGYFSDEAILRAKLMTLRALVLPTLLRLARDSQLEMCVASRAAQKYRHGLEHDFQEGLARRVGRRLTPDERRVVDAMRLRGYEISSGPFEVCRCGMVFKPSRPAQKWHSDGCRKVRPIKRPAWHPPGEPMWLRRSDESTYEVEIFTVCRDCGNGFWGRLWQRHCERCGEPAERVRRSRRAA